MPGRRPKPTAIKVLEGNPGKRPLNRAEPKPGSANTRVPRERLPMDGQRLWRDLAGPLADMGVLKETDLTALEMLCLHYSVVRQAFDVVKTQGLTVFAGEGGLKKHPAASVFRENSAALKSYLVEFGLTPASRVKVKADNGEKEKSLAEILFEDIKQDE